MVDIGFKNSSNSDRNEGPPPPPDWNLIVVDFPPPPPSFDVPVKFPTCFEATLTFLAIAVEKDGSWSVGNPENVPIKGWKHGKPPGEPRTLIDAFGNVEVVGSVGPGITQLPPGMGKDKYNSMEHAIKELQRKINNKGLEAADRLRGPMADDPTWACHIIKMCICCPNSFMWDLYKGFLASRLCPKIVKTAHGGGWFKVLSDSDGDWWIYLNFTLEPVCEGCPDNEDCRCVRVKEIDLTDKGDLKESPRIRRGPPVGPPLGGLYGETPGRTFIYTDSNSNEHVIPDSPGDESFKEVIKKILEIEDEMFDCKYY